MTEALFLDDPYLKVAPARVTAITDEGGIVTDRTIFYARGGGQPGDSGTLRWAEGRAEIASAVKGADGAVVHLPAAPEPLPPVGAEVELALDWERRHRHMRMHTALHLLSVVIPLPVTGGQIGADRSRLDFLMPEVATSPEAVQARLADLVAADHAVAADWVDEEAMDPALVKTMSVQPPRGAGRIRLVRIGDGVDLQPCGGTHVRSTAEIGGLRVAKFENKGRQNRRVTLTLAG